MAIPSYLGDTPWPLDNRCYRMGNLSMTDNEKLTRAKALFPSVIDSTMLNAFRECPTQFWWNYIRRKQPKGTSIHLVAGGAFAKGLEVTRKAFYQDHLPPDTAIAEGLRALLIDYGDPLVPQGKENKSWERTAGAFESYWAEYPLGKDYLEPLAVEFSFAVPIEIRHPITNDPLILAGRADMIARYNNLVYIVDEKTTGSLGPTWSKQWNLRAQLHQYVWAARQYGWSVEGAVIRGIALRKTGYDHIQAIIPLPEWKIERWWIQTMSTIKQMINSHTVTGYWDMALGTACNSYGGCSYRPLCNKQDPEPWLDVHYEANTWDPLARTREEVKK